MEIISQMTQLFLHGRTGASYSRMKGGAVMAYSAALNTIYNHYLSAYAPKGTTRYDAHKRSELKSIYNTCLLYTSPSPRD